MKYLKKLKDCFNGFRSLVCQVVGSFIIVSGWNWYHFPHRPNWKFVLFSVFCWAVAVIAYYLFKKAYLWAVKKYNRHVYWQTEFADAMDVLYFIFSLNFLVFFSRLELVSLLLASLTLLLLFYFIDRTLSKHPNSAEWRLVNKINFILFYFLFILNGILQYTGYYFYILDPAAKYYNIVIFRSFSMTMFWLLGFAVAGQILLSLNGFRRYSVLFFWVLFLALASFIWLVNIGVLYFSGLYFSPVALEHAEGGGGVIWNWLTYILFSCYLAVFISFALILRKLVRGYKILPRRIWNYYNALIIVVGLVSLFGLSSFRNTPEYVIAKDFYRYYRGQEPVPQLPASTFAKLEKFGLHYDQNNFNLAQKDKVYTKELNALPAPLAKTKPNVIIIFLESFSARLTGIYGGQYKDITPGLNSMAADPHTTVINKYYNASTPTVTGMISELCSFLPPTGHEEFERERMFKRLYLYCLPQIMKDNGYKYTGYITAVDKDFANKGEIFSSIGVDEFYGTDELKKYISEEPKAWGYSDHQMFPVINKLIADKGKEPYLVMLSTVDSHPPYSVQDVVPYGDGKNDVLNTVHTTDDAFGKFWAEFKNSPQYKNTVVIAAADHAIFPAAYSKDMLKDKNEKMTFYDQTTFMIYVPDGALSKETNVYASGIDFAPTILHVLGINTPNAFEGHSIFDDRQKFPNVLGMHEFGLYINQAEKNGKRTESYALPSALQCPENEAAKGEQLTLCEFLQYYRWKRTMFEEGRFNKMNIK